MAASCSAAWRIRVRGVMMVCTTETRQVSTAVGRASRARRAMMASGMRRRQGPTAAGRTAKSARCLISLVVGQRGSRRPATSATRGSTRGAPTPIPMSQRVTSRRVARRQIRGTASSEIGGRRNLVRISRTCRGTSRPRSSTRGYLAVWSTTAHTGANVSSCRGAAADLLFLSVCSRCAVAHMLRQMTRAHIRSISQGRLSRLSRRTMASLLVRTPCTVDELGAGAAMGAGLCVEFDCWFFTHSSVSSSPKRTRALNRVGASSLCKCAWLMSSA